VQVVNDAALAKRTSYTDEISRLMAQNSLSLIDEQTKDYRVGPGDLLEISIFEWELREETKTATFRVAESGLIPLPVIGDMNAGGRTVEQIKKQVEDLLRDGGYLKQPRVSVDIKEYRSKRIAVVGAVSDPGVYTLRRNVTTLLDVVSLAGGLSERAGYMLYVIRPRSGEAIAVQAAATDKDAKAMAATGNVKVMAIDLYDLMEKGNLALNAVLTNGDVVNVPEAKKFSVIGYVRDPGTFPLKKPTTVLEGIALARGLLVRRASPRDCIIKRMTSDGEEIIPLDLVAISEGKKPNLYLQPNDIIEVRQTMAKMVGLEIFDALKSVFHVGYTISK